MKRKSYLQFAFTAHIRATIFLILLAFSLASFAHTAVIKEQGILERKVSLQVNKMEVPLVLKKIEQLTEARFVYQSELISSNKISLNVQNTSIGEILNLIFGSIISYEGVGNMVVLRHIRHTKNLKITGKVNDETGASMAGVNVAEKGTANGTMTDAEGQFSILVADENSILVFSSIGYLPQEVTAGTQSILTISMQPDVKQLEDVVVVGYGVQKKKDITTAVARVSSEDIVNQPVNNVTDAMVGKMAGVTITQGTGQPGAPLTIKVRGVGTITAGSDPLYVVDGIPLSGPNLNTLNNNDIESAEVLKDASSAAIYGSRGANGVVIITTKKGKEGKAVFTYNGYTGVQQVAHKIKMMDAYQWAALGLDARNNSYFDQMQAINAARMASGKPTLSFSKDDSNRVRLQNTGNNSNVILPVEWLPYLNNEQGLTNTDWQDQIFRTAPIHSHSLSASGGAQGIRYYSSVEYFKQDGIIINSRFERLNARLNVEANKGIARFGVIINPTLLNEKLVKSDDTYARQGVVSSALHNSPIFPVYNSDGTFSFNQNSNSGSTSTVMPDGQKVNGNGLTWAYNPVALATLTNFKRGSSRILSSAFVELEFFDNLKYKVMLGADVVSSKEDKFLPSTIPLSDNATNAESTATGYSKTMKELNWIMEHTLNYQNRIGLHSLSGLLGWSNQKVNIQSNNVIAGKGFLNNQISTLSAGTITGGDSREEEWALASGIARLQYSYAEKYLLTASVRLDGSSKFGINNRWGGFPSASVGWRLGREHFLKDYKWMDELKIRVSYGLTGNFNIPAYGALGALSYYAYVFGSNPALVNSVAPVARPNADLSWEKTQQTNAGLDGSFFKNKLQVTVDLYNSDTKGLLLNAPVALSTGFDSQLENVGAVNNKGVELSIGTTQDFGKLKWEGHLVYTKNINKVTALGPGNADIIKTGGTGSTFFLTRVGETIGSYFLPRVLGVFKNQAEVDSYPHYTDSPGNYDLATSKPGDFKFEDADGDDKFDPTNDRVVLGSYLPKFTYGFTSNFQYKNFDLGFALQGIYGNKILNLSRRYFYNHEGNMNNYAGAVNRWRSETDTGSGMNVRANRLSKGGNGITSSWHVEDGSYLRVRNITFGYTLPDVILKKSFIERLRIYCSLQNPFTFTQYLGYNPEVTNSTEVAAAGEDYGVYPTSKAMTVGVNLTF